MIKLRLIFHWWCPPEMTEGHQLISNLHLSLLKHYLNAFNEVLIVFATEDGHVNDYVLSLEQGLISTCFDGNLTFKIIKNDRHNREAITYKTELIDKMDKLDGLTFFGHTKGMGDVTTRTTPVDILYRWIVGMYFLNLEFIDDVIDRVSVNECLYYGSYLTYSPYPDENREEWFYYGAFYWTDCQKLYDYLNLNGKEVPKQLNPLIAEFLPHRIVPFTFHLISAHGHFYIPEVYDPYVTDVTHLLLPPKEYERYKTLLHEMTNL